MKTKTKKVNSRECKTSFRMPEADFVGKFASTIVPGVTTEDLANFDDSSFDVALDIEMPMPDSDDLRKRIDEIAREIDRSESAIQVIEQQTTLFSDQGRMDVVPNSGSKFHFEVSRKRFASLIPLVVQAFVDIRDGWSADYVLLSPDKDLDFLKRCWQLGAVAAPEELNWTLMNARKDGKLKGLRSERSFALTKCEMDEFSFAAEMAIRELQEKARCEEQCDSISLDKLLCSPSLSNEFDSLSRQIAPGLQPLQYRWAAMTLRKARRLAKMPLPMPLFEDVGLVRDVRPSTVSTSAGIYWVGSDDRSTFVGVASNLRRQVDSFVGRLGESATPGWVQDGPTSPPRMRLLSMENGSRDNRELMRSSIFRRQGSRLNFKDASLFGGLMDVA